MTDTDLLIVGAGLAGLPIAMACAQVGWRVAVVDKNERLEVVPTNPLDQRCTAIGSASENLLRAWGVWDVIANEVQAIQHVHVSQRGHLGAVRLSAEELNVSALGYVFENRQWVAALSEHLELCESHVGHYANISIHRGESVASVNDEAEGHVSVGLTSGKSITTRLLIGADGVNSRVRDLVGVGDEHVDYEQCAFLSTVEVSQPHRSQACERFTSSGPLALLPRPGQFMSLVWCVASTDARNLSELNDEEVIAQLQNLFGFRLGRIKALGPRTVLPLIRREATRQVGTRTVLLGNAARLLHPVAGQGFNLALRDVACLLDAMGRGDHDNARDPGAVSVLNQFVTARVRDQNQVVTLTDVLAKTFRGEARLPGHVRGLALAGLDSFGPARKAFAKRTMGYTG